MRPDIEAMVKSLVAIAWADGRMHHEEQVVLDALVIAFALDEHDAAALREYAKTPRTLEDLPLGALYETDRRALLQHALLLTHADGEQTAPELALIHDLAQRLQLAPDETADIIAAAARRDKRVRSLR
jgi:tellurite resistance protein